MRIRPLPFFPLAGLILALSLAGCQLGGPAPTREAATTAAGAAYPAQGPASETQALPAPLEASPSSTAAAPASTLAVPTVPALAPAPTPTSTAGAASSAASAPCADEVCTLAGDFLLARPVGPGGRSRIDTAARFGRVTRRSREVNHGASFLNSSGTPVLAAAGGEVVAAGDDSQVAYGASPGVYGNLVILKHTLPELSQPVYTLYAHLSEVSVKVGDSVTAGQEIGKVGMSGGATGSILHFEVRLGENTYQAARNPELWLKPLADESGQFEGALAGRVLDAGGKNVAISNIRIDRLDPAGGPALGQVYLKTYADGKLSGLDPWQESFAVGELPAGSYKISFWLHGYQSRVVQVSPGQLTLVTFHMQ